MARTINARFYVAEVTRYAGQEGGTVKLRPVVKSTPDNIEWSKHTPSGELSMAVTQAEVCDLLDGHRGKDVLLALTLAE